MVEKLFKELGRVLLKGIIIAIVVAVIITAFISYIAIRW